MRVFFSKAFVDELNQTPLVAGTQASSKNSFWKSLGEMIIYMIVIFFAVVIIRYVFISPFAVDGSSMEPNLHNGELIIVNKIGYGSIFGKEIGEPKRGDIVVIIPPNAPTKHFVKRIIGLPGESLEFVNGDIIVYNEEHPSGVKLDESYLSSDISSIYFGEGNKKIDIPERNYFVMGDNRSHSQDSRSFGPVNRQNIVGKTEAIIYPLNTIRVVHDPDYTIDN